MIKSFKQIRESVVKSADKKPEKFTKPDGKVGIRMVPVDKEIVKNEDASKDAEYHKTLGPTKNSDEGIAALKKKHGMSHDKAVSTLKRLMGMEAKPRKEEVEQVDEGPRRKGAPKMTGDSIAIQRAKDAEHAKAMGRSVKTGRKLPKKTMTSTQMSLASLRREEVELDETKGMNMNLKLINKIKKSGVVKTGSMSKDGSKKEETNEVLDTPKAMDSYRSKAKYSKERAANSAAAKMMRDKDGFKSTDTSPELKTMDKRTKGLKMADRNAVRKFRKALTKEEVQVDEDLAADIRREKEKQARNKARTATANTEIDRNKATDKLHKMGLNRSMDRAKHYDARMKLSGLRKEADARKQVDEVLDRPGALDSYRKKADDSGNRARNSATRKILTAPKNGERPDHSDELNTMRKRNKGQDMADRVANRQFRKSIGQPYIKKEEVEKVVEISQDKLRQYHAKAGADLQARRDKVTKGELSMADLKKGQNRVKGLNRSANKMEEKKLTPKEFKRALASVKPSKKKPTLPKAPWEKTNESYIPEGLTIGDGMGSWIKDFQASDAPQFAGKSKKHRRDMAIAAYLSAKRGDKR